MTSKPDLVDALLTQAARYVGLGHHVGAHGDTTPC